MSVLIKDMEKPKTCYTVIDGESEYCPFVNTDDDCVLLLEKGICEGTWEEQYSKCPLVETPEPSEDAVSRAYKRGRMEVLQECDDIVSRKAVLNLLYDILDRVDQVAPVDHGIYIVARNSVDALLPVTPKRKTGKWIIDGHHIVCSECETVMCNTDREGDSFPTNFCPNCGADCRGKQDED